MDCQVEITIGLSVFKNAEGNLVYAHQKPTYHLKAIQKLNDLDQLEGLKAQFPYLKNNYLLNNDAFVQLSADQRQKILRFAGSAVGQINKTEEEIILKYAVSDYAKKTSTRVKKAPTKKSKK